MYEDDKLVIEDLKLKLGLSRPLKLGGVKMQLIEKLGVGLSNLENYGFKRVDGGKTYYAKWFKVEAKEESEYYDLAKEIYIRIEIIDNHKVATLKVWGEVQEQSLKNYKFAIDHKKNTTYVLDTLSHEIEKLGLLLV